MNKEFLRFIKQQVVSIGEEIGKLKNNQYDLDTIKKLNETTVVVDGKNGYGAQYWEKSKKTSQT